MEPLGYTPNFLLLNIFATVLLRIMTSLSKHSGQHIPPMYGDYEAQRHWQEITYNLPAVEWYENTKENNLTYWGLDYPPFTAYHSYFNGFLADKMLGLKNQWVGLVESHGVGSRENNDEEKIFGLSSDSFHKFFMRGTVLLIDLIIYIPYTWIFCKKTGASFATLVCLFNLPTLLFMDYGHFQYNGVSLGLFIGSLAFFFSDYGNKNQNQKLSNYNAVVGSFLFMSSILYKQMNLYYALPVFFFLLGILGRRMKNRNYVEAIWLLLSLIVGVGLSIGLALLPWLLPQSDSANLSNTNMTKHEIILKRLQQLVSRIFPVGRGIFEDKVASFWCTINNVVKIKQIFDQQFLFLLANGVTFLLSIIICCHMMFHIVTMTKSIKNVNKVNFDFKILRYALINVSLIFFLFSYHVHEKSILLAIIPIFLDVTSGILPEICFWASDVAVFSFVPISFHEGNLLQLVALQLVSIGLRNLLVISDRQTYNGQTDNCGSGTTIITKIINFSRTFSNFFMTILVPVYVMKPVPVIRYPDLLEVIICSWCCLHFLLFLVIFMFLQIECGCEISRKVNQKSQQKKKN